MTAPSAIIHPILCQEYNLSDPVDMLLAAYYKCSYKQSTVINVE